MEKLSNIYMVSTCEEKQYIPVEIERMYYEKYGKNSGKRFFRLIKK